MSNFRHQLELEDLFYSYPDISTPDFQTLISAKQEFRELSAPKNEALPKKGEYYTHQELIHRLLLQYDRMLIIARAGTGKTGSVIGYTEINKHALYSGLGTFINSYIKPQRSNIKRVYILVKGDAVYQEIIKQIVCNYSDPEDYMTEHVKSGKNVSTQRKRLNRELAKYYEIMTYTTFYRHIKVTYTSEEDIKKYLSDSLFFIDEGQNLRIDETKMTDDKENKEKVRVMKLLHKVFHAVERSKVVIASATPMVNDYRELIPLMNLLLPLNNQMNVNVDYINMPLQDIRKYFMGYISYIQEQKSYSRPNMMGWYIGDIFKNEKHIVNNVEYKSQLLLFFDQLSDFHKTAYLKTMQESTNEKFFSSQRQALITCYPDGSTGGEGFKKYVHYDELNKRYNLTKEFKDAILKDGLEKYAVKLAHIINKIEQIQGCCFIYIDFVEQGAVLMGLFLELFSYTQYQANLSTLKNEENNYLYCTSGEEADKKPLNMSMMKRYAILPEKHSDFLLSVYNHPQNWQGQYVKVLIGTPRSREGISLTNVISVDMVSPGWNEANNYQAIYRAIRVNSNMIALQKLREEAILRGEDPEKVRINIDVRIHCAIYLEGQEMQNGQLLNIYGKTADVELALISEKKNIEISLILRKMKQCAIDAQIHAERNTIEDEPDYSAICDYDTCKYNPVDPLPTKVDYTSYNVLYTGKKINRFIEFLKKYFTIYDSTTYEKLYEEGIRLENLLANPSGSTDLLEISGETSLINSLNNSSITSHQLTPAELDNLKQIVIKAVYKMVNERIIVLNKFGQKCLIYVDGGAIYIKVGIQTDYNSTLLDSYYSNHLIGAVKNNIDETILMMTLPEQLKLLTYFNSLSQNNAEYFNVFNKLNLTYRIQLIEKEFLDYYKKLVYPGASTTPPVPGAILSHYEKDLITMQEPIEDINSIYMALRNKKKTDVINAKMIRQGTQKQDIQREYIYLHKLFSLDKYNAENEKRIRIFKPSELLGWRDVTEYEYAVYNDDISKNKEAKYEDIKSDNFYAEYDVNTKKIRIHNNLHPKGIDSVSVQKPEYGYILYYLGVPMEFKYHFDRVRIWNEYGREIKNSLKRDYENFNDQELKYIAEVMSSTYTKAKLKEVILEYFQLRNRLIIVNGEEE